MTRTLRGIPAHVIVEYLRGYSRADAPEPAIFRDADGSTRVEGNGWVARIAALPPARVGAISLQQVTLSLEGEPAACEELEAYLRPRLARGGG